MCSSLDLQAENQRPQTVYVARHVYKYLVSLASLAGQ